MVTYVVQLCWSCGRLGDPLNTEQCSPQRHAKSIGGACAHCASRLARYAERNGVARNERAQRAAAVASAAGIAAGAAAVAGFFGGRLAAAGAAGSSSDG